MGVLNEPLREILTELVRRTPSVGSALVREEAVFSKRQEDHALNALVEKLTDSERGMLAQILQQERTAALFDALVWLHECCALRGVKLQANGVELKLERDGYAAFEEYLSLLEEAGVRGAQP